MYSRHEDDDYVDDEIIYIEDDESYEETEEEQEYDRQNFNYSEFINNFMTETNQNFIKQIWGFLIPQEKFPISLNDYNRIIHTEVTNSNLIYIGFNRFCPHTELIKKHGERFKVMTPYTGVSIFRHNRNITYYDIYDTLHNEYIRNNVLKCCNHCHHFIHSIQPLENNTFYIWFKNNLEYSQIENQYNYMLNRIIQNKDPFATEEIINFEKLSISQGFEWDINTKYNFV